MRLETYNGNVNRPRARVRGDNKLHYQSQYRAQTSKDVQVTFRIQHLDRLSSLAHGPPAKLYKSLLEAIQNVISPKILEKQQLNGKSSVNDVNMGYKASVSPRRRKTN